jgi:hypothetical protein
MLLRAASRHSLPIGANAAAAPIHTHRLCILTVTIQRD